MKTYRPRYARLDKQSRRLLIKERQKMGFAEWFEDVKLTIIWASEQIRKSKVVVNNTPLPKPSHIEIPKMQKKQNRFKQFLRRKLGWS